MSANFVNITVYPKLASLSCSYDPGELREEFTNRIQLLLSIFIRRRVCHYR